MLDTFDYSSFHFEGTWLLLDWVEALVALCIRNCIFDGKIEKEFLEIAESIEINRRVYLIGVLSVNLNCICIKRLCNLALTAEDPIALQAKTKRLDYRGRLCHHRERHNRCSRRHEWLCVERLLILHNCVGTAKRECASGSQSIFGDFAEQF